MTKLINEEEYLKWEEEQNKEANLKWEEAQRREPTQEPVAWMHCVDEDITEFNDFQACPKCEPLYTHPKKEWQGLSDDEIDRIYCEVSDNCVKYFPSELYAAWFKALKEKNI